MNRARIAWLTIAVIAAYASALPGDFVWLDRSEIELGQHRITSASDLALLLTTPLDEYLGRQGPSPGDRRISGGYWRPLSALSLSLDWAVFGPRPALFHAENVLWHLAVVLGLYALGALLFEGHPDGAWIAFAAALLFAVHPLGVASVTWITGRQGVMCAAFALASLLALFRARSAGWLAVSVVAAALAGLTKELGLLLPVVATAFWWILRDPGRVLQPVRSQQSRGLVLLWAVALVLVAYRATVIGVSGLGATWPADSPLLNFATMSTLAWSYAGAIFLPGPVNLNDSWPIAGEVGLAEAAAMSGVVLVALATGYALYRRSWLAAPLVWLIVWLLPASGVVPLRHVRAERYLYPAYWGGLAVFVVLAAAGMRSVGLPAWLPRSRNPILAAIALALALTSALSNRVWWSHAELFGDAVSKDPSYVEGHVALARLALENGAYEDAVEHARQAIFHAADPTRTAYFPASTRAILALALLELGRFEQALRELHEVLRSMPGDPGVLCHAGRAAYETGRYRLARDHLERGAAMRPGDRECRALLAKTRIALAARPEGASDPR